jgi:hypothetical protein
MNKIFTTLYKASITATVGTVLSLGAFGVKPAQAATFAFTYEFLSGETLTGTVDGNLLPNGDVVELTDLMASYSGSPGEVFSFLAPLPFDSGAFINGAPEEFFGFADAPAIGSAIDTFGFYLTNEFVTNSATAGGFFVEAGTNYASIAFPAGTDVESEAEPFSVERWTLTQRPEQSVPEPTTVVGVVLVAGTGWTMRRRIAKP